MNVCMIGNRVSHRLFGLFGAGKAPSRKRLWWRVQMQGKWWPSLPVGKGWGLCRHWANAQGWPNCGGPALLGRR